jgi:hypothetical protein
MLLANWCCLLTFALPKRWDVAFAAREVEKKFAKKFGVNKSLLTFALPKRWGCLRKGLQKFVEKIKLSKSLHSLITALTFALRTLCKNQVLQQCASKQSQIFFAFIWWFKKYHLPLHSQFGEIRGEES